jgi:hypothetical protein
MGALRGALEVAPGAWPVEEEPVRDYCFLRLRGRSVPPLVRLEVGGAGEEPAAAEGEVEDDPADQDAARSAVDVARCAQFVAQISS